MAIQHFEPLIITNERKNFIRHGGHGKPVKFYRELFLKLCSLKVIDQESLKLIQILQLHKAIDHTQTATGSAVLLRSLVRPQTDLEVIQSKHESLSEIASHNRLRLALKDFVAEYGAGENALYRFFNKGLFALFPYQELKKAKKSAARITRILKTVPVPESPYLKGLVAILESYNGSPIDRMMNGRIFKTFNGLKSDQEVGLFTPKWKFVPRRLSEWVLAGPMIALVPFIQNKFGLETAVSTLMTPIGMIWTGLYGFHSLFLKPIKDTEKFIEPFRRHCIDDSGFNRAIDAVGMIDELLSFHEFGREFSNDATLPKITDQERHRFEATGLKSPVLVKHKTDCVANTVTMNGTRLTFITGPNSGGKTTLCKTIVHNQILAQIGSYVLAEKAVINIADRISYQAPKFDGLQDDEGRFGTELSRTRDIFFSTGPKSLVILDELAEGTTVEERLKESFEILSDFYTIGNNTVLVTHNHSLVDRFMEEKKGQSLMAEFEGENPTYRIIPGISRISHARRIAEKIGFSKKNRLQYLKDNGYA